MLPNLITLGNLLCGVLAILHDKTEYSLGFIFLAAVLDFLDGFVARLMGISSEMGKQLDSLADVVTFGVAPAVLVHKFLLLFITPVSTVEYLIVYWPLILPLAGAWRLARFNIDPGQSGYFKGLPIPANGFFWIGYLMLFHPENPVSAELSLVIPLTLIMCTLLSLIMVSRLKILNFKVKNVQWKGNESRYFILILSLVIIFCAFLIKRPFIAIPGVLLLYIIISIIHYYILRNDEIQS